VYVNIFAEVSLIIYKTAVCCASGLSLLQWFLLVTMKSFWTLTVQCILLVFPTVGPYWTTSQGSTYVVNTVQS